MNIYSTNRLTQTLLIYNVGRLIVLTLYAESHRGELFCFHTCLFMLGGLILALHLFWVDCHFTDMSSEYAARSHYLTHLLRDKKLRYKECSLYVLMPYLIGAFVQK